MNDDPLSIIQQEIKAKKEKADKVINELISKRDNLQKNLTNLQTNYQTTLHSLQEQHMSTINQLKKSFSDNKESIQKTYNDKIAKIQNKDLADLLLLHSKFDEEKKQIQNEMNAIYDETDKYIARRKDLNEKLILPFHDSIEFDKSKIDELTFKLNEFNNKKLAINKVDKIRKGPRVTKLDSQIVEKEIDIDKSQLIFDIKQEKLNKSYIRNTEIMKYQLKKLRQQVQQAKMKQNSLLSKIEEAKSLHKIKMNQYQTSLLDLTDPKPFPQTKRKANLVQKFQSNESKANKLKQKLIEKTMLLSKIKLRNHSLVQKVRRLRWILSIPTDVTYKKSTLSGIEC